MNRSSSHPRMLAYWVAALLLTALLPPTLPPAIALAQSVPDPCLNDQGQSVLPMPVLGAWALALNFNHAPSTSTTTACRIMTVALQPQKVTRTLVTCTVNNNSRNVQVGGGAAAFDGNFWITCPNGPPVPGYGPLYNGFAIYGQMQFPTLLTSASFSVVQHQDVELSATVNASGKIKLTSRYGSYRYQTADSSTDVTTAPVFIASSVGAGAGSHQVAQTIAPFTTPVDRFPFSFSQPFLIGQAGKSWTLYELVIDPPPPRGSFSG